MKVILDTDILSEARHPKGDPAVKQYLLNADEDDLYLSVITLGEIARGIAKLDPGTHQSRLEAWLADTEKLFATRLLTIDRDIAVRWGRLTDHCARKGVTLGQADGLIAATALENGMAVVTGNRKHFEPTGVKVISPGGVKKSS